jgi:hypothetical protein
MHFREDELENVLNPLYLQRGRVYQERGRVISAELQKDDTLIAALVRGSGVRVYKILIRIGRSPAGGLEVTGQCSCPMHYNCKHVAAALLEVAERMDPQERPEVALPWELGMWFDRLREAERRAQPDELPDRLLYLLNMDANYAGSFLTVTTVKARRLRAAATANPPAIPPAPLRRPAFCARRTCASWVYWRAGTIAGAAATRCAAPSAARSWRRCWRPAAATGIPRTNRRCSAAHPCNHP